MEVSPREPEAPELRTRPPPFRELPSGSQGCRRCLRSASWPVSPALCPQAKGQCRGGRRPGPVYTSASGFSDPKAGEGETASFSPPSARSRRSPGAVNPGRPRAGWEAALTQPNGRCLRHRRRAQIKHREEKPTGSQPVRVLAVATDSGPWPCG